MATPRPRSYWRRTLRVTGVLLALWFGVTFGVGFFARELQFRFFGWPFSFWAAAQGALVVYVLIIAVYAWAMNRVDREQAEAGDAADGQGGA
jgi:putative solute:sodium symporter small subunit